MNKRALISIIIVSIILLLISLFFPKEKKLENLVLSPIGTINLSVTEPSGLYYDAKTKSLWTVSDENSNVYNIDLKGNIIDSFTVDGFDLEGITIIEDSIVVAILERDRSIIFLDREGNEIRRVNLNISGEPNKGIEGITYSLKMKKFFVVNEKEPRALFLVDEVGNIVNEYNLNFAKDFSGIFYDETRENLWIISDENSEIFLCTVEGDLLKRYKFAIEQVEGVAIDNNDSLLYLVSDPLQKLYIFKLP